jgi:DNA-directed RNA polymerase subunit alpha
MTAPYRSWPPEKLEAELSKHISELGMQVRTCNRLDERGIFTVRDLLHCTKDDLMEIPNFGDKTYAEIMLALRNTGFH